jgi:hypothetical protein
MVKLTFGYHLFWRPVLMMLLLFLRRRPIKSTTFCRRPIHQHFLDGVQVVRQQMVHFAAVAAAQTRSNKLIAEHVAG